MKTWIDVQHLDSTGKRTICEARPAGQRQPVIGSMT